MLTQNIRRAFAAAMAGLGAKLRGPLRGRFGIQLSRPVELRLGWAVADRSAGTTGAVAIEFDARLGLSVIAPAAPPQRPGRFPIARNGSTLLVPRDEQHHLLADHGVGRAILVGVVDSRPGGLEVGRDLGARCQR